MIQALLEIVRQKKWQLIAIALCLLLNIGLLVWIDGYQSPAISGALLKWNDLRRSLANAGRESVENKFKQGKTDLETLQVRIPPRRQFPRLLGDILESAASSGVAVGALSYKPQTIKDEHLLAYGVTIGVSGRYAAIKSFLADQLRNRELLVVDEISLKNSDPYEEYVSMDLKMTVYLREEP
jgi:type IV pilus assembly protein PilO